MARGLLKASSEDCQFWRGKPAGVAFTNMIDSNTSGFSRIDAVKASVNQLKIQAVKAPTAEDAKSPQAKVVSDEMRALDNSIKAGDPQKAEIALFHLRSALRDMTIHAANGSQSAVVESVPEADAESTRLSTYA